MSFVLHKKSIATVLMVLAFLFILAGVTPKSSATPDLEFTQGGISYRVVSGTDVEVAKLISPTWGTIDVPAKVINSGTEYNVVRIGDGAFSGKGGVEAVNLPDSITSIGNQAFLGCSSIKSLNMTNVITIGNEAFFQCYSLQTLSLPVAETIGSKAFYKCGLMSVSLPKVKTIGDQAFYQMSALTELSLPSAETIGNEAFYNCEFVKASLASIKTIGEKAFYNCNRLTDLYLGEGLLTIGKNAFGYCSDLKALTIPKSVTTIGSGAFSYCTTLKGKIVLGDKLTSIGDSAFLQCNALEEIVLPKGIDVLPKNIFDACTSLKKITIMASVPPATDKTAFNVVTEGLKVYVPAELVDTYKAAKEFMKCLPRTYEILPVYIVTTKAPLKGPGGGEGDGGGAVEPGGTVTLIAKAKPGYSFIGWYNETTLVSTQAEYTFEPTGSINLYPKFEKIPQIKLKVSIDGGGAVALNGTTLPTSESETELAKGSEYILTATPAPGKYFAYWEDDDSTTVLLAETAEYRSKIGSDTHIRAVFYDVTTAATSNFTVIFTDKNGKILKSETVSRGASATAPTVPAFAGYVFKGWSRSFSNVSANIIVMAVYDREPVKYTVTVVNGTLSGGGTTGDFEYDKPVTVTANTPPSGKKFSHWEQDGIKISTSETIKIFMPMSPTTLTAVFIDTTGTGASEPFITLSNSVLVDSTNNILTFTARRNIPTGYTLVESGVLMLKSNTLSGELTVSTAGIIRGKIKNDSSDEFYVRKKNTVPGEVWYARAYLIFSDSHGNIITVYSANAVRATA